MMAEEQPNPICDETPLDAKLFTALRTAPEPNIPAGFAARVAGRVSARPNVVVAPRRYGPIAAVACVVVQLALMLAFAHRPVAGSLYELTVQTTLYAQFVLLTVWMVVRNAGYTLPDRSH